MSKKFKSLICTLLAGMMFAASTGIAALAADTADTTGNESGSEVTAEETAEPTEGADAAEAKDAAEASEEPAADATEEASDEEAAETEAPATEASATEAPAANAYDNDTYYQNALQVVSALGIITGYEDGSVKPESTVTRAEMATIVLRMLAQNANSTYQNVFTDLEASHWAADTIQTAVEQGILDGMGDGTFVPDGNVKYEQVLKMLVCAMNYGTDAENAGGYPQGYVAVGGTTLKLLAGVKGAVGEDMPRGEVIKTVYNALLASYREITDFKNGLPVYTAKDSLGVALFDMYEEEGLLTTTENITIATGAKTKKGVVTIDGTDYRCDLNVDEYVGTKIKFYYIDDKADDPQIIALFSLGKSTEYTFDADDIESIDTESGAVKVYPSKTSVSTKNYKINNAAVIYNGTMLSTADYNKYIGGNDYDGFITPDVGSVKIIDYDNDGTYDIIFVESYETMLVTNASTEKLTGKINNENVTITYDLDDNDYTITVKKSGSDATVKNLKKNDVASIKRNVTGETIDIIVTGEVITGTITSVGEDDGDATVTVNGQVYKVDVNAADSIRTGISGNFYLDMFDRVGYIDTDGNLSSSEKYAMITNVFYNDESELVIRLYDDEGAEHEYKPSGSIKFWGGHDTAVSSPSESELYSKLSADSNYIKCGIYPVKLCKYSVNSKDEITKLYVAVDASTVSDGSDALTLYNGNLNGVASIGGTVAGYYINDGIIEFTVPDDASDRTSGSNYNVGTVTASSYKNYENGVAVNYTIGDFTNVRYPSVLVKFSTSATSVHPITDVDTAVSNSTFMLSKVNEAVDSDGDTIFELRGYSNGTEISYMTASNTGVYDYTGWDDSDGKFVGDILFNATKDEPETLLNSIQPGDVFVVTTSGSTATVLVRMVDVNDVAATAIKGESGAFEAPSGSSAKGSNTRDKYYGGFVSGVDTSDSAFISLMGLATEASGVVTYDLSSIFSYATVTVDGNGKVTNVKVDKTGGIEPSELVAYGEDPSEFDYGYFKSFKGTMGAGYIIRIDIEN